MQGSNAGPQRRTLDPKLDIVFWMLFGAEQNRELLISLLNAVLSPAEPIEAVEVLPAQPENLAVGSKNISLDVRLRLQNGEQVDVEMQSQRRPALRSARFTIGRVCTRASSGAVIRTARCGAASSC